MNYRLLTLLALLLVAAPLVAASHAHDAPLWAKSADYATPTSTSTHVWYDDTNQRAYDHQRTRYVYHDIYHPPRVWYVHRNENFYRTHAGTRSAGRSYRSSSRGYGGYGSYDAVYHGDGFSRYY